MTEEQEKILKEILDTVRKDFIKIKYDGDDAKTNIIYRKPSNKEIVEYRKSILKDLYNNGKMCRSAYYTLKAMNRRRNMDGIINVLNFIKKHDHKAFFKYLDYINTEHPYMEINAKITFPIPVAAMTINISTPKEEDK